MDRLDLSIWDEHTGVDVNLIVGKGQVHCYPLLPDFIPDSKQAMVAIAAFVWQELAKQEVEPAFARV